MTEYLPLISLLAIPVLAVLRVMDGGWHRPPGSNLIMWLAPVALTALLTQNYTLTVAALLLGWQLAQGYEDWNDYLQQAIRCVPVLLFAVLVYALMHFELATTDAQQLVVGVLAVCAGQLVQPWLRHWASGRGPWGAHSNRYAEALEGGTLAVLIGVL